MKFKIHVSNERGEWWENYELNTDNPQEWAERTVKNYNETLRSGEVPRTLLGVEVVEVDGPRLHSFFKLTNGQSVNFRGRIVDLYQCRECPVTAKRFGLSEGIIVDSKFKRKFSKYCMTQDDINKL